jgi:calpain-7
LVASQYEKFAPLDYTLSVFSTTPFVCRPVPHMDSAPNAVVLTNEWKADTAGGRPFFSTFMHNPQYHVQLDPTAELRRLWIFLETTGDSETTEIPLNLRVITHSQWRACGLPAVSAATSPLRILSSGEYRPGFCLLELDGGEGDTMLGKDCSDLVVIPSTFEPDTMATFRIRIVSELPEAIGQVSELPMEGYGMQSTILHGQWNAKKGTAVGCASYGCYTFNPKYLVHVSEESYLFARLVPARGLATHDGSSSAALPSCNVSIYASNSDGTLLLSTNPTAAFRHATSDGGAYASGNPSGVVTPSQVVFPGGWYVIIPSTYDPQEGEFELRVYSSKRTVVRHLEG